MSLHRDANGYIASVTPVQQILSSCSGAVLTSLLTTPFDVVKVRLQAQQNSVLQRPCYIMDCRAALDGVCVCTTIPDLNLSRPVHFSGTLDAFVKLAQREGVASWWMGLGPTLAMAVPMTVIYYTGYDQLKMVFGFKEGQHNVTAPLLAGSLSRTIAVAAVCPLELIRTKMQSRLGYNYREVVSVIHSAVVQNGVLSLWRGLSAMLLRDVPFSIFYWIGYEELKNRFRCSWSREYDNIVPFIAGSISGCSAAILTNPLDVIKTHMQVQLGESTRHQLGRGSLVTVLQNVVAEHGVAGLFAGLVPRCAKIAPACSIMIGSYEACKRFFVDYNRRHQRQ